jgi:L-threonylcarbamoyladenylate synthase
MRFKLDRHRAGPLNPPMVETLRLANNENGLSLAAEMLAEGALVAFPTETVYGLGCDASNPDAVARLYAAKGRPQFNPLIAHVATLKDARQLGRFNALALRLAEKFWPGPLTLVVPVQENGPVCDLARAGLQSIAIRIPASELARSLIQQSGKPIAAPSANRSGHVSPTSAAHVLADLDGRIDAVLMGPDAEVGLESTILAVDGRNVTLLRAGGLSRSEVEAWLGRVLRSPQTQSDAAPRAPGRLASHYAPRAAIRLNAKVAEPGEAILDFANQLGGSGGNRIDLSPSGDLTEAAARLYAALRALDAMETASIAVAPIPAFGLGEGINDRLARAAAPRG